MRPRYLIGWLFAVSAVVSGVLLIAFNNWEASPGTGEWSTLWLGIPLIGAGFVVAALLISARTRSGHQESRSRLALIVAGGTLAVLAVILISADNSFANGQNERDARQKNIEGCSAPEGRLMESLTLSVLIQQVPV